MLTVLMTRPKGQNTVLTDLLKKHNYHVVTLPTLLIKPLRAKALPPETSWVIFISVNAAYYGQQLLNNHACCVAAVGQSTAAQLNLANIAVDVYPKKQPSSESLLKMPVIHQLKNEHIVIVRGLGGQQTLKNVLSKNNQVSYREVYQRIAVKPSVDNKTKLTQFLAAKQGVIVLSSVDGAMALWQLATAVDGGQKRLKTRPVVAFSQRILAQAQEIGFSGQMLVDDGTNNQNFLKTITKIT